MAKGVDADQRNARAVWQGYRQCIVQRSHAAVPLPEYPAPAVMRMAPGRLWIGERRLREAATNQLCCSVRTRLVRVKRDRRTGCGTMLLYARPSEVWPSARPVLRWSELKLRPPMSAS